MTFRDRLRRVAEIAEIAECTAIAGAGVALAAVAGAGVALAAVGFGAAKALSLVYPPPPASVEAPQPKRFRTPRQRWATIDDTVDPLASRTSVRGSHREFMESLARYGALP